MYDVFQECVLIKALWKGEKQLSKKKKKKYIYIYIIPNILIPHLSRLAKQFKQGDYCYANGPKIKLAVSPNEMPLSL